MHVFHRSQTMICWRCEERSACSVCELEWETSLCNFIYLRLYVSATLCTQLVNLPHTKTCARTRVRNIALRTIGRGFFQPSPLGPAPCSPRQLCMYACMHVHACMHAACMHVCMYVCMYVYICMYVHTCCVLIKLPIPYITFSRCKRLHKFRPVEILLHERGWPRPPHCKSLK